MAIVGAGPGGGAAALTAAKAGLKTLVVDRKAEIGLPVRCGEGTAEDVLTDFGMSVSDDCIRNKVNAGLFVSSSGKRLRIDTKNNGVILNRTNFEKLIIDNAVSAGAELALKTNVTGLGRHGLKLGGTTVKTDYIIAADGIESLVGTWAGINTTLSLPDIGICAQYTVSDFDVEDNVVEMYWGEAYTGGCGYAWIFPRGGGAANLGLGVAGGDVPKTGMKPLLDKFIDKRCGKGAKKENFQVGSIPQCYPISTAVKGNVILVGDAARFAIPLTGAGIGHALFSGKLASNTLIEMQKEGAGREYLQNYDVLWRKKLEKKLRRSYKVKERFRKNPKTMERIFTVLKPLQVFHRLFPNFIEKIALRNYRY